MFRISLLLAIGAVGFIYVCAQAGGLWPFGLVVFWPAFRFAGVHVTEWQPLSLDDELKFLAMWEER